MATTLYVSDMDGTLLDSESKVSAKTAAIISELSVLGALFTVATARTPATVVPLLADTRTVPPAIVMTGAALWHRDSASYSDVKTIDATEKDKVVDICHNVSLHPFVYTLDDNHYLNVYHGGECLSAAETEFYKARASLTLKRFHLSKCSPAGSSAVLCYAMGCCDNIFEAAKKLQQDTGLSVSSYYDIFDPTLAHLEVFAPGVSKASAIMTLKSRLRADRVVVFGDNLNDLSMMAVADCAVAVDNAFEQVKNAADIIIGSNDSDAVARFVRDDFQRNLNK